MDTHRLLKMVNLCEFLGEYRKKTICKNSHENCTGQRITIASIVIHCKILFSQPDYLLLYYNIK